MSNAYYNYECKTCGQTTTDTAANVGDVLDVAMDCWSCGSEMEGSIHWDEKSSKEPLASYIDDNRIKIDSL